MKNIIDIEKFINSELMTKILSSSIRHEELKLIINLTSGYWCLSNSIEPSFELLSTTIISKKSHFVEIEIDLRQLIK